MADETVDQSAAEQPAATSNASVPAVEKEGSSWVEICAAILLGIAGVLTAYAAFNSALSDGDALKGYTQSSRTTADANGFYNDYAATYNADQSLFLQYQLLVERGETDLAQSVRGALFSAELETATQAWEEPGNEAATPLDTDAYVVQAFTDGEELTAQAETEFNDAFAADEQGDKFELASVFLAVALFFAGIASLFKVRPVQIVLLIAATGLIVPGIIAIAQGKGWA